MLDEATAPPLALLSLPATWGGGLAPARRRSSQSERERHLTIDGAEIRGLNRGAPEMTVDDDSRITRAFLDHEADLGRFLAQMVRDRELANDLLQDTWLAVVSSRGALPSEEAMVPWLFGIARNRALTALRGRRRAMEALRRLTTAVRPAVVDPRAGDADALRDFLESVLGAEDRSLFLLRYVFGFSSEELARMTGRSSSAVRKRLSRAAQTVADALDRADPHLREVWSING